MGWQESRKEMKAMVVGEAIFHIANQNVQLREFELRLACDRIYGNVEDKKKLTEVQRLCGCVLEKQECTNSETPVTEVEEVKNEGKAPKEVEEKKNEVPVNKGVEDKTNTGTVTVMEKGMDDGVKVGMRG